MDILGGELAVVLKEVLVDFLGERRSTSVSFLSPKNAGERRLVISYTYDFMLFIISNGLGG